MKNFEKDFEKNLSEKMSELSDNVNCFDKIARRAFPEQNSVTEDGYYSESGLENVTGKRRFSFVPVIAVACAVVLCSVVVMQSSFKEFFSQLKDYDEYYNDFNDIKSELDYELENFSYIYYDLSFEEYQMNIGCINPLAECPLVRQDESTNVRVYTKCFTVGSQKTETNQIYLVRYINDYCDENIISITDSKAKFSRDDKDNATLYPQYNITWQNAFNTFPYSDFYYEGTDDMQDMFEINYRFLYKEQDTEKVYDLISSAVFWFEDSDTNQDIKHYDIVSIYNPDNNSDSQNYEIYNINTDDMWNETIYQYDEPTGFDDNKEENYFRREHISDDMTQNNIFIDRYLFVNDYSSSTASPSYERQMINSQRTIEVKISVPDDDKSRTEKITKIAEYSSDISHSEVSLNNITEFFSRETIDNLKNYGDDFIERNTELSDNSDSPIERKQNEYNNYYEDLLLNHLEIQKQIEELEKNESDSEKIAELTDQLYIINNEIDAKISVSTASDYIQNNFRYRDKLNNLESYATIVYGDDYSGSDSNQSDADYTEYYKKADFDLSDAEYYDRAEVYFDVVKKGSTFSIQDIDIKIYFQPDIYNF